MRALVKVWELKRGARFVTALSRRVGFVKDLWDDCVEVRLSLPSASELPRYETKLLHPGVLVEVAN